MHREGDEHEHQKKDHHRTGNAGTTDQKTASRAR